MRFPQEKAADLFVSVIVPAQGATSALIGHIRALHEVLKARYQHFEILVMDSSAAGQDAVLLKELLHSVDCVRYLRLSRSPVIDLAVTAGFEAAIGDCVCVTLPGIDPPSEVPSIVHEVLRHGGIVLGRQPANESGARRAARRLFFRFCNSWLDFNLVADTTYLMGLSRTAVNSINQIKDRFRSVRAFATTLGLPCTLHDYAPTVPYRRHGGYLSSTNLAIDLIISNSTRPLRWVSLLGLATSGFNLLYIVYVVGIGLFKQRVAEGWLTLSFQNSLAYFTTSLVLATLCEYLSRVLLETKDRPHYIVVEEQTSSVFDHGGKSRLNVVDTSR